MILVQSYIGQYSSTQAKITCGQETICVQNEKEREREKKRFLLSREYRYGMEDNKANKRSVSNKR